MTTDTELSLAALLGSRICHDLISPLGAIGNGVELMAMTGVDDTPELALISDSVVNANARIRFFRLAFGVAAADQQVSRSEIMSILAEYAKGARININWNGEVDPSRGHARLAFLLVQCLEVAMPFGGEIRIGADNEGWCIEGQADKLKITPALWDQLTAPSVTPDLRPAEVQFALAPMAARDIGTSVSVDITDNTVRLRF